MQRIIFLVAVIYFRNCFCSYLKPCDDTKIPEKTVGEKLKIGPSIFYPDLESVIDFLRRRGNRNVPSIRKLLEYFDEATEKKKKFEVSGGKIAFPLLVLEGLSGTGKTTVAGILVQKLNATRYHSPPITIQNLKLRESIRGDFLLNNAYHYLCNYISSFEVTQLLSKTPVIMDRFWASTLAYSVSYAVNNYPEKYVFPAKGDEMYNWPPDLVRPDVILFLDVVEGVRKGRISWRNRGKNSTRPESLEKFMENCDEFRLNLIRVYKNIENPSVEIINATASIPNELDQIYAKIQHLFPNLILN